MIGVDEVGRGCWAGPLLVVAARPTSDLPNGLTDSKLLKKKTREELLNTLSNCCEFGEGWVSAKEIDHIGLAEAMKLGVARSLKSIQALPSEEIILDGSVNYIDRLFMNAQCLIDADFHVPIVSAASIYAKVSRDNFMQQLGLKYPKYGFENHVGYGTKRHRFALEQFGVLEEVHRTSFKPIKALLQ
jgi:ribonuclease HII